MKPTRAIGFLDNALKADSPRGYASAILGLLDELHAGACAASLNCSEAWQDDAAGRPWSGIALALERAAIQVERELDVITRSGIRIQKRRI